MPKYNIPLVSTLKDIPEFVQFQDANPKKVLTEKSANGMYCRAIHWMSILNIIWPNFDQINHYEIDAAYLVPNDPDWSKLPEEWFLQMAQTIAFFWKIQLEDLYPDGNWEIFIDENKDRAYVDIYHSS